MGSALTILDRLLTWAALSNDNHYTMLHLNSSNHSRNGLLPSLRGVSRTKVLLYGVRLLLFVLCVYMLATPLPPCRRRLTNEAEFQEAKTKQNNGTSSGQPILQWTTERNSKA